MRTAKRVFVVYVRQKGKTYIYAAETSEREARHYFKAAESTPNCDRIWLEVYKRDYWDIRATRAFINAKRRSLRGPRTAKATEKEEKSG